MNKLIALTLVAGLAPFAFGAPLNQQTVTASVRVLNPITLKVTGGLNFGTLIVKDPSSSVSATITPTGSQTLNNAWAAVTNLFSAPSISGSADSSVTSVNLTYAPANTYGLTYSGLGPTTLSNNLGQLSAAQMYGTVTVAKGVTGSISGSITVTANYN
jgi:hypothetical protein